MTRLEAEMAAVGLLSWIGFTEADKDRATDAFLAAYAAGVRDGLEQAAKECDRYNKTIPAGSATYDGAWAASAALAGAIRALKEPVRG